MALMLLAGCHDTARYDGMLQQADRLLELSSDSAEAAARLLDSIHADSSQLSLRQQMRYGLLRVKARNKQDRLTAGDTAIADVAKYYERNGTPDDRVEALYLLARVYHDMGRLPQAIETYQLADEAADTTRQDCNYKHLFLVHSQLSDIYSKQRMADRLDDELDIMKHLAAKAKDTLNMILCDMWRADVFWNKELHEEALAQEQLANRELIANGYERVANGNNGLTIHMLLAEENTEEARKYMDKQEQESGIFDENGNIEVGREIYYFSMGLYQLQVNHLDSARQMFSKLLTFARDKGKVSAGYRGLLMLYQKTGQKDSIAKYALLYGDAQDAETRAISAEKLQFIKSLYDYEKYQRHAKQKEQEAETSAYIATIMALLLVVVLFLAVTANYIYRRRVRHSIEKKNERYAETYRRYVSARSRYEELEAELSRSSEGNLKLLSEKNDMEKEISRLSAIISNRENDERRTETWEMESQILTCPEVVSLHQYAVKGEAPDSLWVDLMEKCKLYMPRFMEMLSREEAAVTSLEMQIAILIKLHFIGTEIQNLLGKSSQSITNSRTNINKKLFGGKGVRGLDTSIHAYGEQLKP